MRARRISNRVAALTFLAAFPAALAATPPAFPAPLGTTPSGAGSTAAAAAAAETVALRCSGQGGIAAMEASYVRGPGECWGHLGLHTYDAGAIYRLGRITGQLFSVEIQFSPPVEFLPPLDAPVVIEASRDGLAWTRVGEVPYPLAVGPGGTILPTRQSLAVEVDAGGIEARFLRVRQPKSAARGLSGFLDSSRLDAEATLVSAAEPGRTPGTRTLTCAEHVMERIFAEHPCWFGGINRYDGASFFHTFPLGGLARLGGIEGEVVFLPWRTDDYERGATRTGIRGFLQSSVDGVEWTTLAEVDGRYGAPIEFTLDAGPVDARYVRLAAERHAQWGQHPALKHPRGMILHSRLTVSGDLPSLA